MTTEGRPPGWAVELWPEPAKHRPAGPYIEAWEDEGGFWEWMYHGSEDGTRLPSNRRYATKAEAVESARIAYPLVPVREVTKPVRGGRRRRLSPWIVFLLVLALIGLATVILFFVIAVSAAIVLRRRLHGRKDQLVEAERTSGSARLRSSVRWPRARVEAVERN